MEKQERKSRTSKLRRIETGIWFLIIVVFISIGIFVLNKYENSFETHKIYMPDVDGLIVGSPVNLMGIPVGYVTKTKIINDDEVVVKFKITNKSIHIQEGTIATVEFSGLGGSKSLELFPPSSNKHITKELVTNNNTYIIVERPKRLRDCWSLLYQMYQKIMNMIYSVSNFGTELNRIENPTIIETNEDISNFIDYTDGWLQNSKSNMNNLKIILDKYKGKE